MATSSHAIPDFPSLPVAPQKEAEESIASCDCHDYLVRAEKRLNEEQERVANYLDPSSETKITRVVETALILNQVRIKTEG